MEVYNLFYGAVYLFTGLWTGSFLNVCVWRFPRQLSPIKGRSSCPRCGHALSPGDLVPVFSWLFLRGKCRYCHRPISRRYPLTEALTGLVFLLCFYVFGAGFRSVPACLFASALITAAWIDWDFTYIPDGISLFILLAGLLSLIPLPAYGLLTRFPGKPGRSYCCGGPHRICAVHCLPAHRRRNRGRRHQASGRIRLLSRPPEGASCPVWGLCPGRRLGRSGTDAR